MQGNGNFVVHLLCCRNYMNDSLRTNVFVRFQAETIACACIYLAARVLQVQNRSLPFITSACLFWDVVLLMSDFSHHSFRYRYPLGRSGTCCLVLRRRRSKIYVQPLWNCIPEKRLDLFYLHLLFWVSVSDLFPLFVCFLAKLWIPGEGSGQEEGGSTGSQTESQRTESRWHSCSLHIGWILSWIQTM